MEYTLSMVFITKGAKKVTFSVSGVKQGLTAAQVNALMDTIIAQNAFTTDSGDLASKDSAQVTQKQVSKFEIAK